MNIINKTKSFLIISTTTLLTLLFLINTMSFAQCTDKGNVWDKSWISCSKSTNPKSSYGNTHWLIYEFDEPQSISESYIWNANKTGESINGAKEVRLDYSVDGFSWIQLGTYTFPKATELDNYSGFAGPDFGGIFVKKILLTIVSTYGNNNCASIAEVQFKIDENACYGTYDACGDCNGNGPETWYADTDNDGLGSSITAPVENCVQPNGYVTNNNDYCDNDLVGWKEVGVIFKENGCTGCHGSNALGGLDLTNYESAILGGNKCGSNILNGTVLMNIININNYDGCGVPISFPSMNERVGGNIDPQELAKIKAWIDGGALKDCNCPAGSPDADNDGYCDVIDNCADFNNDLIGTNCDDGLICTIDDVWIDDCTCTGTKATDTDSDGVCDFIDLLPDNPCSADGSIDGDEPENWRALPTNDCDQDLININNGDQSDFDACFDNTGQLYNSRCLCTNNVLTAGANYVGHSGVGGTKPLASGKPDGNFTGYVGGTDYLDLEIPYLLKGEEICVTVDFSDENGKVSIELNFKPYTFFNTGGLIDQAQEFCITNVETGPVYIRITDAGAGSVRVDGVTYTYCKCLPGDPLFNTPQCKCANDFSKEPGSYTSATGITNADNANGEADGVFTNGISGTDVLNLTYTNTDTNSEICLTLGFSDIAGVAVVELNNKTYYINNVVGSVSYEAQEYCFPNITGGDITMAIREAGIGTIKVDGSKYGYCNTNCIDFDVDVVTTIESDYLSNDATANLSLSGIAAPYLFNWSNGAFTSTAINLTQGNYTVEVIDINGCSVTKNINIQTKNCPPNFIQTDLGLLPSITFKVQDYIQSNGHINNGANVLFKANNYIELNNNFEVKPGGSLEINVEECE